jgi:hypothetical protein
MLTVSLLATLTAAPSLLAAISSRPGHEFLMTLSLGYLEAEAF